MTRNDRFIALITGIITAEVKDSEGEFPQPCLQTDERLPPGAISWLLASSLSPNRQFINALQFHWTVENGCLSIVSGVLSGRGLCDGLITRPEESYRVWCV
jgi:hypothetical protein